MHLEKHEVTRRHHSARRIHRQSIDDVVTEAEFAAVQVLGRSSLGNVWKQRHVAVRIRVTVGERQVSAVYLPENTYNVGHLLQHLKGLAKSFFFSLCNDD